MSEAGFFNLKIKQNTNSLKCIYFNFQRNTKYFTSLGVRTYSFDKKFLSTPRKMYFYDFIAIFKLVSMDLNDFFDAESNVTFINQYLNLQSFLI